jgi:hypothetical protein
MKVHLFGRLARKRAGRKGRRRSWRRLAVYVGASFGVVVNYIRTPSETFLEFVWFALWSGVVDVISH